MDTQMMLSVIIPTYKFAPYIKECVDSVLSQQVNFDYEVLIGDDFSEDGTVELLNELYEQNTKVKIFAHEKNLGPYENIKILMDSSRGKYISYLDGDDYFLDPTKLQRQVDFLEANPDYCMHATGYYGITHEGKILPLGSWDRWYAPVKSEVDYKDLLKINIVGWGRTFRNIKGSLEPWIKDTYYVDWGFNFSMALRGKIKCEEWCGGAYRQSPAGMFSAKPESEKTELSKTMFKFLDQRLIQHFKKLTIIDCFIRNQRIENKLRDSIKKLKSRGEDVMLVSNTIPSQETLSLCDFFFYDSRNQLFQKEDYVGIRDVDFFRSVYTDSGSFIIHNITQGVQKHGLSVLANLTHAVRFAKELGYRYFQRIEADDLFGEMSIDKMQEIYLDCLRQGKEACFYFNESTDEKNISFHYFLSDIDFFIKNIPPITSEEEYRNYLLERNGDLRFVIAEEFIYQNLLFHEDKILKKDGGRMSEDFKDTTWNTEVSGSNMPAKYKNCTTAIYKTFDSNNIQTGYVVLSYNYERDKRERRIICSNPDGQKIEFTHVLETIDCWNFHPLPAGFTQIEVWEDGESLYSETTDKAIKYIQF